MPCSTTPVTSLVLISHLSHIQYPVLSHKPHTLFCHTCHISFSATPICRCHILFIHTRHIYCSTPPVTYPVPPSCHYSDRYLTTLSQTLFSRCAAGTGAVTVMTSRNHHWRRQYRRRRRHSVHEGDRSESGWALFVIRPHQSSFVARTSQYAPRLTALYPRQCLFPHPWGSGGLGQPASIEQSPMFHHGVNNLTGCQQIWRNRRSKAAGRRVSGSATGCEPEVGGNEPEVAGFPRGAACHRNQLTRREVRAAETPSGGHCVRASVSGGTPPRLAHIDALIIILFRPASIVGQTSELSAEMVG